MPQGKMDTLSYVLLAPQSAADDIDRLRGALIQAGRNAGAVLDDGVTTDFLMNVPSEVRLKIERMLPTAQAQIAEHRSTEDALRDALTHTSVVETKKYARGS